MYSYYLFIFKYITLHGFIDSPSIQSGAVTGVVPLQFRCCYTSGCAEYVDIAVISLHLHQWFVKVYEYC